MIFSILGTLDMPKITIACDILCPTESTRAIAVVSRYEGERLVERLRIEYSHIADADQSMKDAAKAAMVAVCKEM
jgi:hypothetical protein